MNTFLWVQGPFFVWRGYPLIKKYQGLFIFSPFAIAGAVSTVGLFYYAYAWSYSHFLYYPALFVALYSVCLKRFRYERADALVLTFLSMVSMAMLWEMPIFIKTWTASLWNFQVGIASAGWEFMAIPILVYFLAKINKGFKPTFEAKFLLAFNIIVSLPFGLDYHWASWNAFSFSYPEVSLILWFAFFVSLLSRNAYSYTISIHNL